MSEHQAITTSTAAGPPVAPVSVTLSPQEQITRSPAQVSAPPSTVAAATTTATAAAAVAGATVAAPADSPTSNGSSRSGEELLCQWQGCSERCPSAEVLYDHVCDRHVGRKSTNNLNLTCQWGTCRTTTVKRDHITSHIRVHVPLKPHKCEFCGKAFKRPQDLKKHVKTHADDSVLVRSPEPSSRNPDIGYPPTSKGYAAAGHQYFEPINQMPSQGYSHNAPNYYQTHPSLQQSHPNGYGNVYYTLNNGGENESYGNRKRGYDVLNEFFGDLKRRQFDPNSYAAVGQRLLSLQNLNLPLLNGPVPEYQQPMPAAVAVGGGGYGLPISHSGGGYQLPPMSSVRTKNDLINIDQFLEQMQNTIYESDDHIAAAGVAQPGAHYVLPGGGGISYRTTHSPPTQLPPSHAIASGATGAGAPLQNQVSAHSPSTGTPALTPPSSAQSYSSGRSPTSLPSAHHHESGTGMYPRLPSTTIESMNTLYASSSGAAPPSTLSGIYDDRRRYTGGTLQRARPADHRALSAVSADEMDIASDGGSEDDRRTIRAKKRATTTTTTTRTTTSDGSSSEGSSSPGSTIDPALHSSGSSVVDVTTASTDLALRTVKVTTESPDDRTDSQWLQNVRLIERLRELIAGKLQRGEFEDESKQSSTTATATANAADVADDEDDEKPQKDDFGHDGAMEGVETAGVKSEPVEPPAMFGEVDASRSLYPALRVES